MELDNTQAIQQISLEEKKAVLLYPKQKYIDNPVILKMVLLDERTGLTLANLAMHTNQHINDVINEALGQYAAQFQ